MKDPTKATNAMYEAGRKIILFVFMVWSGVASATTYYVSSSTGNDANSGTSAAAAWQTVAQVNGQTFLAGDSILFKRGDVWNESLVPSSSGSAGNPITFDAYGSGAAPNLTGYYAVPAMAWVQVTGNAWKAPLPASYTTISFCLFGSVWGQKVAAASPNLTAQWDFFLASGYVYVYSVGSPASYYNAAIVPMALSNVPVINVNGKSWLTFQHFLVNWFDEYGVYVQGASDHLVFANMEADSMIPQGTQPLGFYVNESAPGPGDIKIFNSEAHLNYDGFRFDGAATAIAMVNDKGYANRDGALVDNTGAVTYSYCHFYASSLAVAGSTDVEWTSGTGPTAGAGNIAADTAPAVQVYQRYPAMVTLTVDDAGMTAGADTYYAGTVLPVADAAGVPVGAAITVGYPLAQTLVGEFQGWVNAGRDVVAHSMSHTYYTNLDALDIQYKGSGTAAALSIGNKTLTITVAGATGDSVSYNLAQGQAQGTIQGLRLALVATGKFTATEIPTCQGPYGTGCSAYTEAALLAQDLADVSGQDVKSSAYAMQLDVRRLTTDEITLSRQWMTTNLTGLPATPVYVYPGGYETTAMQGITEGVPYAGARGALKEDLGVKDTYADGFNAQNVTSFGVNPTWMGIPATALNEKIQALVWKEAVWGVPWGIFWHVNELTNSDPVGGTEITNLIQDFKASGATILTNTGLVNWLLGGAQETGTDGNYYYKLAATSGFSSAGGLDFRPTKNSPVVDAGQNLGAAYAVDINGVNQNAYGTGWEIGAHVYEGYAAYGGSTGPGEFTIGETVAAPTAVQVTLPQTWVNSHEGDTLFSYELSLPGTWISGPAPSCTFHAPYWTGAPSSSGLQSAINDIEACRTATGVGIALDIPPGLYSSASGLTIPQTNSVTSSSFLVLRSTQDASLPDGNIVCAHGMQDDLASSSDIGLVNPDCTGQNMYYALGAQGLQADAGSGGGTSCVTASMTGSIATFTLVAGSNCATSYPASFTVGLYVSGGSFAPTGYNTSWTILSGGAGGAVLTASSCYGSGPTCVSGLAASTASGDLNTQPVITGITTLSANTTTLAAVSSAMVSGGIPVVIPLTNGYVAPGNSYTVDTGANQEIVAAQSGPNQIGIYATFTKAHAYGASVTLCATGCAYTLANGTAINTENYNDAQSMWTVETSGNTQALQFCSPVGGVVAQCTNHALSNAPGPDHWLIEDGEFRMQHGNQSRNMVIQVGAGGAETALSQLPAHIHFRKDWIHGDYLSLAYGSNAIAAGIELGGRYVSLGDSQINQILSPGTESHGVTYSQGGQAGKVVHNWIEGGSIGSLCGGIGSVGYGIAGSAPCQNMQWGRNRFTFPFSWLGTYPVPASANWGTFSLFRKNAFETKETETSVAYGNIFENVDASGGQNGPLIVLDGSNSSSGQGSNYQSIISNFYLASNVARNGCAAMLTTGNAKGGQGGVALGGGGYLITNNLWYQISNGNSPGCGGADKIGFQFGSYPGIWGLGTYGTMARSGNVATFTAGCNASTVGANDCPGGTGGLPYAGTGMAQSDIRVGDSIGVEGCTDTSFNTNSGLIFGTYSDLLVGTVAASGTTTNGLTIRYANAGPDVVPEGETCTLYKRLGWPYGILFTHNSLISDKLAAMSGQSSKSDGSNQAIDALFRDSIMVTGGGWTNTGVGASEGTSSENFNYDKNSLSAYKLVWPGRAAALYTEYGNNPGYADAAGCTGSGCTPPVTMYFPATAQCSGTTSSAACVGFAGAMSATAMPLTLPDYHSFALRVDSSFYAGNAEDASDGGSMGAALPAIDAAQTTTTFVCPYACGSPGPYPDRLTELAPAELWGFSENSTQPGNWPTVPYTIQRFWDTPGLQFSSLNPASGVFNFTNLDSTLALAYSHGTLEGMYTLARTPVWASANPTDWSCSYASNESGTVNTAGTTVTFVSGTNFQGFLAGDLVYINSVTHTLAANVVSPYTTMTLTVSAGTQTGVAYQHADAGYGPGECYPPNDLNADGSGTDAIWKAWITAIATHVDDSIYLQTHEHIKYWEIWNEPDTEHFFHGTIAQLARLTEDANCIITGRGVIHGNGDGSFVACTATPIDPSARIVMASAHAKTTALQYGQNELYCNNTAGIAAYELPCPNPPNAIATAVDIVNFHMKPGNELGNNCPSPTPCTVESAMQWYISNIEGILQPAELAKPLWNGEAQYSSTGFTLGSGGADLDVDTAESVMPRLYLMHWSLGVDGIAWYYANSVAQPAQATASYQQVYDWLAGASLSAPCTASGTVWSCGIVKSERPYLVMWDTAQSCSNGSCTTANQTVGSQWTQYQDMTSASTVVGISEHSVPVGIKAVVIQ